MLMKGYDDDINRIFFYFIWISPHKFFYKSTQVNFKIH